MCVCVRERERERERDAVLYVRVPVGFNCGGQEPWSLLHMYSAPHTCTVKAIAGLYTMVCVERSQPSYVCVCVCAVARCCQCAGYNDGNLDSCEKLTAKDKCAAFGKGDTSATEGLEDGDPQCKWVRCFCYSVCCTMV